MPGPSLAQYQEAAKAAFALITVQLNRNIWHTIQVQNMKAERRLSYFSQISADAWMPATLPQAVGSESTKSKSSYGLVLSAHAPARTAMVLGPCGSAQLPTEFESASERKNSTGEQKIEVRERTWEGRGGGWRRGTSI